MTVTINDLEQRLSTLEQDMAFVKRQLEPRVREESPEERTARLLDQAQLEKPLLTALWSKAMREIGATGQAIPAEQLRQMMAECGVKPEENLFSQGIREMREE